MNSTVDDTVVPFGKAEFQKVMRTVASGVTVITTAHDGQTHGMTATAFSSVSADPPTVLIVVNKSTRTHPILSAGRRFVVNLLAEDQTWIGERFAGKLDQQFETVEHRLNDHGIPVLAGNVANLECEVSVETDAGTHTIFIGRVLAADASDSAPLVYHDGRFKSVVPLARAC